MSGVMPDCRPNAVRGVHIPLDPQSLTASAVASLAAHRFGPLASVVTALRPRGGAYGRVRSGGIAFASEGLARGYDLKRAELTLPLRSEPAQCCFNREVAGTPDEELSGQAVTGKPQHAQEVVIDASKINSKRNVYEI